MRLNAVQLGGLAGNPTASVMATSPPQRQCAGRHLVPEPRDQRHTRFARNSTELATTVPAAMQLGGTGLSTHAAELSQHGDAIDLHLGSFGQRRHLNTSPRRLNAMAESFGIDGVDLGEVAEINQKHRGAHHLLGAASGSGEHRLEVAQHLPGFRLHISAANHRSGCGI